MTGGAWMAWGWLWPALVVIGLVLLGYVAVRLARGGRPGRPAGGGAEPSSVRQILDERFARGEIDEDEYRRRRGGLS